MLSFEDCFRFFGLSEKNPLFFKKKSFFLKKIFLFLIFHYKDMKIPSFQKKFFIF